MSLQNNKKNHNVNFKSINAQLSAVDVLHALGCNDELRMSDNIRLRCTIHGGDKQNSLVITPGNNIFVCHSCGAKGDLIELYARSKNIQTRDAAFELASLFNIESNTSQKEKPVLSFNPASVTTINGDIPAAVEAWNKAENGDGHPYLSEKGVGHCDGLKYGADEKGNHSVVIPFKDIHGHLRAVQYVNERAKIFATGSKFSGAFFHVGDLDGAEKIYITEGIATMLSVWNALDTEQTVVMCGSKNNVVKVVEAIKSKYSHTSIVVCLERDANDPEGQKMKESLKHISGVSTVMPQFPEGDNESSDFNDVQRACEIDEVSKQLQNIEPFQALVAFNEAHKKIINESTFSSFDESINASKLLDRIKSKAIKFQQNCDPVHSGIILGFEKFDNMIDGFQKGQLIVVGGRPGMGKTSFALSIFYQASVVRKIPAAFVSLEMSSDQLICRLLNMKTNIPFKAIKQGSLYERDIEKLTKANVVLSNSPLLLSDNERLGFLPDLLAELEKIAEVADIIIIDYIGLISAQEKRSGDRFADVGDITRSLKKFAMQKQIPIIILAQVNRQGAKPTSPQLHELRESGSLEQDADVVIFVHRESYYDPSSENKNTDVIVAKNREGDTGIIEFHRKTDSLLWEEVGEKVHSSSINVHAAKKHGADKKIKKQNSSDERLSK